MWFEQMHPDWQTALADCRALLNDLEARLADLQNLVPDRAKVMAAFETDPAEIRVVILGQDPYPTPGVAIGHSFAVRRSTKLPASLKNIEAELRADIGENLSDPELGNWRKQGVWLLNTCLTALENHPGVHSKIGWQQFTEAALANLASRQPLVILAWGKPAQALAQKLKTENTRIVESAHPSPLSAHRGFLGSHPFSRANAELQKLGLTPIDW